MSSHIWGEKDFDWKGLNEAIQIADKFMTRWGRIDVHSKEKYGTARLYIYFYTSGLFSLLNPGYVSYYKWFSRKYIGKYLLWLEYKVFQPASNWLKLYRPVQWWQRKVYNWGYQRAIKQFPHLIEEILESADYPEFITDWHKHMAPAHHRYVEYLEDRWHKTAEFYERAMKVAKAWDLADYEELKKEYEEFDS